MKKKAVKIWAVKIAPAWVKFWWLVNFMIQFPSKYEAISSPVSIYHFIITAHLLLFYSFFSPRLRIQQEAVLEEKRKNEAEEAHPGHSQTKSQVCSFLC